MADLNVTKGSNRWVAVAPSDTVSFTEVPRAIYVGVTGDVTMVDSVGNTVLFKAMPVGEHAEQPSQIKATGTTATNIVALY
jgi:hypothetical protein